MGKLTGPLDVNDAVGVPMLSVGALLSMVMVGLVTLDVSRRFEISMMPAVVDTPMDMVPFPDMPVTDTAYTVGPPLMEIPVWAVPV